MDLNELRDRAYKIASEHGFHDLDYSDEYCLMLVITELSEAVDADRKGKRANKEAMIETIEAGGFYSGFFERYIKGTVEEELADVCIRLLDLAGLRKLEVIEMDDIADDNPQLIIFCFDLAKALTGVHGLGYKINLVISHILLWCKNRGIDIIWHIKEKMKYNSTREYKHGKKY